MDPTVPPATAGRDGGARRRQEHPVKLTEVQDLAAQRVPLNDYDASLTNSGAVRAWNNLGWNLTTTYEHAGWLHATTDGGFRLTREGRQALDAYPDPMDMYDAGVAGLPGVGWPRGTNSFRTSAASPDADVLHTGSGAAHTLRACTAVLTAWRTGDSAFAPGTPVWSPGTTGDLRAYLDAAAQPIPATLPGARQPPQRGSSPPRRWCSWSAPSTTCWAAPSAPASATPLIPAVDPPALPSQLSADLEQGFVHGGKALTATPVAMLQSFVRLLDHWWTLTRGRARRGMGRPLGLPRPRERRPRRRRAGRLPVCLLAHPRSFTTVLRRADRDASSRSSPTDSTALTGDVETGPQADHPRPAGTSTAAPPSATTPPRCSSSGARTSRAPAPGSSAESSTSRTASPAGSARDASP